MGLCYFIFINDLDHNLSSQILKFADDKLIPKFIELPQILTFSLELQSKLIRWTSEWQMEINSEKCSNLYFGQKNNRCVYQINSKKIKQKISKDWKPNFWNDKKDNDIHGKEEMIQLCKTVVRLNPENCMHLWKPYLQVDVNKFRLSQTFRGIKYDKWETRRLCFDLNCGPQNSSNIDKVNLRLFFKSHQSDRRGRACKMLNIRSRLYIRKYSFLKQSCQPFK